MLVGSENLNLGGKIYPAIATSVLSVEDQLARAEAARKSSFNSTNLLAMSGYDRSLAHSPELLAAQESRSGNEGPEKYSEKKFADISGDKDAKELSLREEVRVRKMKSRDKEVRDHERAHATAGGGIASAPKYEMMIGPDGQHYAVGGEVKISLIRAQTPEQTIKRMEQVIKAAMAPVRPSAGDRSVAVDARVIKMEAELEIQQKNNDANGVGQVIDQVVEEIMEESKNNNLGKAIAQVLEKISDRRDEFAAKLEGNDTDNKPGHKTSGPSKRIVNHAIDEYGLAAGLRAALA